MSRPRTHRAAEEFLLRGFADYLWCERYKNAVRIVRRLMNKKQKGNIMAKYIPSEEFNKSTMVIALVVKSFTPMDGPAVASKGSKKKDDISIVIKEALSGVNNARTALSTWHYQNTLPWLNESTRVIPSVNHEAYRRDFEGHRDGFDTAVRDFIAAWPETRARLCEVLGGRFDEADYPDDVRDKFGVTLTFKPLVEDQASVEFIEAMEPTEFKSRAEQMAEFMK